MKTSTKYLLAALLVLLSSLTAYNLALRAEYHKGTYKDELRDYRSLDFKNFSEVDLPAASLMNVKVVAGPYAVHLTPEAARYVKVSQQGQRLVVALSFPDGRESLGHGNALVISCPRLARLRADGTYQLRGKPQVQTDPSWNKTLVLGFRQDSLVVEADRAARVQLADNKLAHLQATARTTAGKPAVLELEDNNHIAAADFQLANDSELQMNNVAIPQARCKFSNNAKVTLTGAAVGSLVKQAQ